MSTWRTLHTTGGWVSLVQGLHLPGMKANPERHGDGQELHRAGVPSPYGTCTVHAPCNEGVRFEGPSEAFPNLTRASMLTAHKARKLSRADSSDLATCDMTDIASVVAGTLRAHHPARLLPEGVVKRPRVPSPPSGLIFDYGLPAWRNEGAGAKDSPLSLSFCRIRAEAIGKRSIRVPSRGNSEPPKHET